jgi:hypothetical protein
VVQREVYFYTQMMQLKTGPEFLWKLTWSLFAAFFFILIRGYTFNGGDQEEHLPYVYKLLNASLYPGDYLVPYQTENFTVRFYYAWTVALISKIIPVHITVLMLHVFSLTVFAWMTGTLAYRISINKAAFVASPLITMAFFNTWTTGGNSILDAQFTCTIPAMSLAACAFYAAYCKRYYQMALFAGLACLFQVLTGLQAFIILVLTSRLTYKPSFPKKVIFKTILIFLVASGPMLLPVLYRQFVLTAENPELYHFILFEFRNAHHYLPSEFPFTDYLRSIALLVIAFLLLEIGLFRDFRSFFKNASGVIIVFALLYFIAFEVFGWNSIGKIQWFKTTVWLTWMSGIIIISFIAHSAIVKKSWNRIRLYGLAIPLASMLMMILMMVNAGSIHSRLASRYQFRAEPVTDLQKMHWWIRQHTPPDAMILIPPNDDRYLCEAQRGTPVAWKGIIHESWFMIPWYRDFTSVYGKLSPGQNIPAKAATTYRNRPDHLIRPARQAGFRLLDLSMPGPQPAEERVVHREGQYVLLRFTGGN